MRRTYKPLFWRATRSVNTADCKNEWKYFLKYNINISIIIRFKQYLLSIIQSVEFTGRVARQNNRLYVLRMIVKLAYRWLRCSGPATLLCLPSGWRTYHPLITCNRRGYLPLITCSKGTLYPNRMVSVVVLPHQVCIILLLMVASILIYIHTFSAAPCGAFQQPVYNKIKVLWLRVLAGPL